MERKLERRSWDGLDGCRGIVVMLGQRLMNIELPGGKKRRPQRRFIDVVKNDMKRVGLTDKVARDRVTWRQMICRGNP